MPSDYEKRVPRAKRETRDVKAEALYEPPASMADKAYEEDRAYEFLSDLQGNILEPHARHHASHIFLSFGLRRQTSVSVRSWIRGLALRRITTAWQEAALGRHGAFCSLLLSGDGYRWLGEEMPESIAFQTGMKGRGPELSDPPVTGWEPGYQKVIHALLILANHDPLSLAKDCMREKAAAYRAGISVCAEEPGYRLLRDGHDIEHFGYRDGISQPKSEPGHQETALPSIAFADAVLVREPHSPNRFGSFVVFRKLEQNVALWEQNIIRLSKEFGIDPELAGAFAIGRFKDGTPVTTHERMQHAARSPENNFSYSTDIAGSRCPLHAHIRKTNPRFDRIVPSTGEPFPRIARRGITYGLRPDLHPAGRMFPAPSTGVGLLFICYQNNIERQFEYIQKAANSSDLPLPCSGPDPLIAQGDLEAVVNEWPVRHNDSERVYFSFERTVTLKGGEYLYAPSLTFLGNL